MAINEKLIIEMLSKPDSIAYVTQDWHFILKSEYVKVGGQSCQKPVEVQICGEKFIEQMMRGISWK